jgi:4-amino-4-deoxy-L-arabinose transferase-like glycosyltransferase
MTIEAKAGNKTGFPSAIVRHPLVWVGALWLIHVGMNLWWRYVNVMILGWDRPAHLVRSVEYLHLLQPFSLDGALNALTNHSFYPPLFHLSAAAFFALFGISADAAAMTNAVYLAVLLFSIYGIGRHLYDEATGLLAACLVSLFPILFNLARYTYIDFAMLALVALSVLLLLKSNGFRDRRWAYLLGVALGLGLLAKWVFAVFAGLPCLYVLLRSPVPADLRDVLKLARPQPKQMAVALAVGLAAAAFWLLPGEAWQGRTQFALWLALDYAVVMLVLTYLSLLPSRPFNNLVGTLSLTMGVAGIWYIPNFDFIRTGLYKAYYVGSETQPAFQPGPTLPIGVLLRGIVNEHLGAPIAALTLALVVAWLLRNRKPLSYNTWLLGLWFIVPLGFFASFSNQTSWNMRLTICVLLPLSVVLARGCLSLPRPGLRHVVTGSLLALAFVQWLVLSLDVFAPVPGYTSTQVPGWGTLNWFAGGEFVQWPSSQETDKSYWVAPTILQGIENDKHAGASRRITIGLLVNQAYLNGYHALFLAERDYPDIDVVDLFRDRKRLPVYPQIFSLDYVLVSNSGIGDASSQDQSTRLVTSILTQPTTEFAEAFREFAQFKVPNGDVMHLFRNQKHEPPRWIPPELTPKSAGQAVNINFGNQMLLMSYDADSSMAATQRKLKIDLFWEGLTKMEDDFLITVRLVNAVYEAWGQQQGHPSWDSFLTQEWSKGQVVLDEREIPVLPGTPPGSYQVEVTAYGVHNDQGLNPVSGQPAMLGPIEIPKQTLLSAKDLDLQHPLGLELGGKLRLLGYSVDKGFRPGESIRLTLFWQALTKMDQDYTIFAHLLDPNGMLRGQKDNPPANGFYPTSRWEPGEIVRDPYEVPIDGNSPAGDYSIEVGVYLPSTGIRLLASNPPASAAPDRAVLGPFRIATEGSRP